MLTYRKYNVKQFWLLLGSLALLLLLAACNTGGSTGSVSTPIPTSTPTPKPSPTPSEAVYDGVGYNFNYPHDWKMTTQNTTVGTTVSIVPLRGDQNTAFFLTVTSAVPATNLEQVVTNALVVFKNHLSNYQQDTSIASSVKIGGDTWKEGGATGNAQGTPVKNVIIVDQHPAGNGKFFVIHLNAPASSYDQINTSTFQSILQSFKFA